jgi:predicted transcriptional regulator
MSPYLSRTPPENYVEGRRRVLYSAIFDRPGISFTELQEAARIRFGVLQDHLETLERIGAVESVKVGRFRRYFPVGLDDHDALKVRAYAADPKYLRTLVDLESLPGSTNQELHRLHPTVTRQAVSYRLERLAGVGAVEPSLDGQRTRYRLAATTMRVLENERASQNPEGHCPSENVRAAGRSGVGGSAPTATGTITVQVDAILDLASNPMTA